MIRKNAHFLVSGIIILAWLCQISCSKEEVEPVDFRNQFIGEYQVHERIYSYGFPECGESFRREKDTVIVVTPGNTDTTLMVLGREVWLDSLGKFDDYHYFLRMRNDSILSNYMNGGLGCGQKEIYEGYRIRED